jgi:hypothetical protein
MRSKTAWGDGFHEIKNNTSLPPPSSSSYPVAHARLFARSAEYKKSHRIIQRLSLTPIVSRLAAHVVKEMRHKRSSSSSSTTFNVCTFTSVYGNIFFYLEKNDRENSFLSIRGESLKIQRQQSVQHSHNCIMSRRQGAYEGEYCVGNSSPHTHESGRKGLAERQSLMNTIFPHF